MVHHKHRSSSNASRYKRHVRHKIQTTPNGSSTNDTLSTNASQKHKKQPSSTAWENIVIHYLRKLKNYWGAGTDHPQTPIRETSAETFRKKHEKRIPRDLRDHQPTPCRYSSSTRQSLPRHSSNRNKRVDYCQMGKRKALNIVSNALEYGLANGIVSKNGNYYWIKDRLIPKRVSNHRMLTKKELSVDKMETAGDAVEPAMPQSILKKKGKKAAKKGVKRITIKGPKHTKRSKKACNCKNCKQIP